MAAPETDLAVLYREVSARLTALLLRVKRDGGQITPANRAFIVRTLRRLDGDLQRIEARTAELLRRGVRPAFAQSSREAIEGLRRAGVDIARLEQGRLALPALAQLEARVSTDLRAIRTALGEGLALEDPLRRGPQAVVEALKADGAVALVRGQARVRTPAGHYWEPEAYAKMLSRTAIADARREAFRANYEAAGVDLVEVVDNGTSHAACAVWEGRILSLTGDTPGYPTVEDARAAGLFHPNCRHRYVAATVRGEFAFTEAPGPARRVPRPSLVPLSTLGRPAPRTPRPSITGVG